MTSAQVSTEDYSGVKVTIPDLVDWYQVYRIGGGISAQFFVAAKPTTLEEVNVLSFSVFLLAHLVQEGQNNSKKLWCHIVWAINFKSEVRSDL